MCVGHALWAHLVQNYRNLLTDKLKGGLAASQTTTNHMNRSQLLNHYCAFSSKRAK
jgi:hypothetical protein